MSRANDGDERVGDENVGEQNVAPISDPKSPARGNSLHDAPPGPPGAGQAPGRPFSHLPVMEREVVDLLAPAPPGVVLDATVGGGGHARAILAAHSHLRLVGLDQDPDAVTAARATLAPFGPRAAVYRGRFDHLGEVLDRAGVTELSGVLFDLGVSSPQLDRPERGFTFRVDAPLDMRMDPDGATTAADLVNAMPENELVRLLLDNGESRFARRVARAIIAARPITTTNELAEVVRTAIPAAARRTGGHPARRAFQGLRIAVNEELDVLPVALDEGLARLAPGGRAIVLAYHSGEDRLVKRRFSGRRHRGVHLSARSALPVRGHADRPPRLPGRPQAVTGGAGRQPPLGQRPPARRRATALRSGHIRRTRRTRYIHRTRCSR